jgi:hypothetical protein
MNWSMYGTIIDDTHGALRCLQKWRVTHVKREGNKAAHRLAKQSLSLHEEYVILKKTPPYILDIVSFEHRTNLSY